MCRRALVRVDGVQHEWVVPLSSGGGGGRLVKHSKTLCCRVPRQSCIKFSRHRTLLTNLFATDSAGSVRPFHWLWFFVKFPSFRCLLDFTRGGGGACKPLQCVWILLPVFVDESNWIDSLYRHFNFREFEFSVQLFGYKMKDKKHTLKYTKLKCNRTSVTVKETTGVRITISLTWLLLSQVLLLLLFLKPAIGCWWEPTKAENVLYVQKQILTLTG